MIFCAVAEPRNSGKSAKFARNLIKYMSIQHIWNLSWLLGLLNCRKFAYLSWNFITTTSKHCSKTTRRKLCCEKLGTSHDVKSFAIGSFHERFVVKIANDSLLTRRHLVSLVDFYVIFWPISRPKRCPMIWNPYVTQTVSLGYLWVSWLCLCDLAHFLWRK